jgi:hypothetical protein
MERQEMNAVPFTQLAALDAPGVEALLLSLAGELGGHALDDSQRRIERLSARLDGVPRDPTSQLAALARRVGGAFEVAPDSLRRPDHDDLRPDAVLATRRGDDLLITMLLVAIGHRRGWAVDAVTSRHHAFVAHRESPCPLLIGPLEPGRVVDPRHLDDGELRWRCPHELVGELLRRLDARAERVGNRVLLVRVRELALALPLCGDALGERHAALARARAAWN